MQHAVASAGLGLLALGILAVAAGLAAMVFMQDEQPTTSDGGVFADPEPGGSNEREKDVGQTIAVGGGVVAFLGLVLVVVGRAE